MSLSISSSDSSSNDKNKLNDHRIHHKFHSSYNFYGSSFDLNEGYVTARDESDAEIEKGISKKPKESKKVMKYNA